VRVALGATRRDVLQLIAGRTFRLVAIGALLGVAGGWAIGVAIRNTLFGVSATDPLTYGVVLALVVACGAIAACVPAYGALAIDPVTVLNRE
jgi:putative ABC transport system permease protein